MSHLSFITIKLRLLLLSLWCYVTIALSHILLSQCNICHPYLWVLHFNCHICPMLPCIVTLYCHSVTSVIHLYQTVIFLSHFTKSPLHCHTLLSRCNICCSYLSNSLTFYWHILPCHHCIVTLYCNRVKSVIHIYQIGLLFICHIGPMSPLHCHHHTVTLFIVTM